MKEIRRFAPAKRYAMVACFLAETHKAVLDHVIEMHRTYMLTLHRHAKSRLLEREHATQHRARDGLSTILIRDAQHDEEPAKKTMADVFAELGEDNVRSAVAACAQLESLGERGLFDEIRAGHHLLKRYLPTFLRLPFEAQPGSATLVALLVQDGVRDRRARSPARGRSVHDEQGDGEGAGRRERATDD